jgi:hypothetical protein
VDDERDPARRRHDILAPHRVALNPGQTVLCPARHPGGITVQRPHAPATFAQTPRDFAADASGRAEHQGNPLLRHVSLHVLTRENYVGGDQNEIV